MVLERALAIDEREFGKESVKVAVALTTFAEAYRKVDGEKTARASSEQVDIFDLEGLDGEGIERGPPPAPAPYERPDSPIPESEDDDESRKTRASPRPRRKRPNCTNLCKRWSTRNRRYSKLRKPKRLRSRRSTRA